MMQIDYFCAKRRNGVTIIRVNNHHNVTQVANSMISDVEIMQFPDFQWSNRFFRKRQIASFRRACHCISLEAYQSHQQFRKIDTKKICILSLFFRWSSKSRKSLIFCYVHEAELFFSAPASTFRQARERLCRWIKANGNEIQNIGGELWKRKCWI